MRKDARHTQASMRRIFRLSLANANGACTVRIAQAIIGGCHSYHKTHVLTIAMQVEHITHLQAHENWSRQPDCVPGQHSTTVFTAHH